MDCFVTDAEVVGDVKNLTDGLRILACDLVNEVGATKALGEGDDDVFLLDFRKRVLLFGEMLDVFPEGLAGLLGAAMEVPRVAWPIVGALKVVHK